ncbi:MAG TPA: autotransporter-associated beta strand repeat-containing protein, partial [Gemmataceae bacterium]|nr:autotransporter-associated beta strand repeat-containing protein [Gemmataceae bacterium]
MALRNWLTSAFFRKIFSSFKTQGRRLRVESLEDRTVPSTFQWTGAGGNANWNTAANWALVTGSGSFPNAVDDVAQFNATYSGAQTALVNQAITVGEIDWGSTRNITINGDGISSHTLTLSASAGNTLLNVGAAFTNSGLDVIAAPLVVAAATPLTATVSGGTLQLTNTSSAQPNVIGATSTFTVNTNGILEGSADPANPALGSAAVVLGGGTLQLDAAATAASTLANAVSVSAAASSTLNTTGINPISLTNAVTFGGNDNLTVSGTAPLTLGNLALASGGDTLTQTATSPVTVSAITGTAAQALTLVGPGTVALPNASAGDAAPTTLNGVTVSAGNATSLGTGDITVSGSDTLLATAAIAPANNVVFNTSSALTVGGTNSVTLPGVLSSASAGAGSLVMAGSGTLALQGVNTFSGNVTANAGTIAVNGSGTDVAVTAFNVNGGATLLVDDSGTNVNNRLGTSPASAAALNLAGGTFTLTGNASAPTNEQLGNVTVQSGYSTVNLNKGAGGNLTLGANTLAANTTLAGVAPFVNFVGPNTGSGPGDQLTFTTNPTLTNGILPYATVTNGANYDFATVAANSLAAFALYNATTLGAVTGSNTAVVKLTANDATMPAAGVAPYAVIVQGNATVTGAGTLTTSTLALGGTDTLNLPVNVGSLGTVVANAGAIATFDGVISGTALDVAGTGTTILNNADTYAGPTTLESGTLSVGNPTSLGSGALNLLGGTIQASVATTIANAVNLTTSLGTVTFGGNTPLTLSGTTTLAGNNTVTVANTGGTTLAGQVTGSGGLTVTAASTGTLALTNSSAGTPNDYTAGTTLLGGNLLLGASSVLGSGPLTLGGGTLRASAAVTPTNAVTISGPVTFAGSNPINLSGATTLLATGSTVSGFGGGGTGWQVNSSGIGSTPITSNVLTLTDGANNETRSAFSATQVATGGNFTTSFTYTAGGSAAADGFAFVLQNQALTALGGGGGSKGYGGITPSFAVQFNIFTAGGAPAGTTFSTNGAAPANNTYDAVAPVNLASGNPINISIGYNAGLQTLTITFAEQNTTNTFTRTYSGVNLNAIFNGSPAWVGFTGATGGLNAIQSISNFNYTGFAGLPLVVNNATTLSGVISGNSNAALTLAPTSLGTLTLGNSGNTHVGGTIVNGGTLSIASPGALGAGTLTLAGAANGATLTATAALTGGNSITNPVALAGLGTLSGSAINFSGATTLSAPSTLTVNNSTTFAGIIGGAAANTLTTAGSGSLTLTAANTYSGATVVNGGTLTLSGANGAIASSASLTVNTGGTVLLDNSGANNNTRLGTSAGINLNGGTFQVNGNGSTALNESLGALTLGAGSSTLASNPDAAGSTLTFASLSRPAGSGGFVNFTGTGLGSTNQVVFTGLTNTGGLLPYATVNGTDFAATTATGIQSYTASGGSYVSTVSGASSGANVNLAGNDTVTSSKTINALMFSGGANATLTINAGVILTVTSGALFLNSTKTLTIQGGGTLALGEAIINSGASGTLTVASDGTTLTGSNLTLVGTGTVNLPAANSFGAGATTLGGATLNLGTSSAIGSGTITFVSGTLTATTSNVKLQNALAFNNSTVTLGGANPLIFSGNATLGGTNNTLTVSNTGLTILNGAISTLAGAVGNLTKAGTGTLVLSGANTYTGQTIVNAGVVQVQNNTALGAAGGGAAVVTASGASIQVLGSGLNIGKALLLNGTGVANGALENLFGGSNTWSGSIFLNTASTIAAAGGTTLTISGVISGPGNLTTGSIGTVVLNAANTYTGATTVQSGVLNIQNGRALGLPGSAGGAVTVGSNGLSTATLQLQGGITVGGKALSLNGVGFGNSGALPQGALVNQTGNNTWAGTITLNGTVGLTSATIPLLTAATATSGTLIGGVNGTTLFVTGAVNGSDLTKVGAGALALLNINGYSGATTVLGGNLTLSNNNTTAVGATTVAGSAINGVNSTVNNVVYTNFSAGSLTINLFGTLGTSAVKIGQSGSVTLDNGAINLQRFTNGTAPNVTFNTGSFTYVANNSPGAVSAETVGTVTLNSGQSTINSGYTAAPVATSSTLTFTSLVRNTGATVNFVGGTGNVSPLGVTTGSTTNQLLVNSGLTSTNGSAGTFTANGYQYFGNGNNGFTSTGVGNIIPFAVVGGGITTTPATDFASYSAAGITAFGNTAAGNNATSNFSVAGTLFVTSSNDIIRIKDTGTAAYAITIPNNTTIGALLINSANTGGALSVIWGAGSSLTLSGGAYISTGTTTQNILFGSTATSTLTLPGASGGFTGETFVTVDKNGSSNRFTPTIIGSGGLVTNGIGAVIFDDTVTGTNYSGGITVNSGQTSVITTTASFGTGPITLTGGTFLPNANTYTLPNAVNLNGYITIQSGAANSAFIFAGPTTLTNHAVINGNTGGFAGSGNIATFTGAIGESGGSQALTVATGAANASNVTLYNTDTYSGGTYLVGGPLTVAQGSSLGGGAVTFAGGSLAAAAKLTINNAISIPNTTAVIAGNTSLALNGAITLLGQSTLQVTNTGVTTVSGTIAGNGVLTTTGSTGNLLLNPSANTSAGTSLTAGNILVGNATAFGAGTPVLLGGSTVIGTSALSISNPLVLTGGTTFTGSNALTFAGNATLAASSTLTVNNSTTFNGILAESGGAQILTAAGVGTLTLNNAANVYSGGTTLSSNTGGAPTETLVVGSATALGGGALTLTSGTLQVAGAFAIPNAVTFGTGGEVIFGGSNPITFTNSGANTLTNATPSALIANTPTTINAVLSGAGGLVFLGGASSFTLTGANTYTGATVVSGGTLTLGGGSGALASATTINRGGTVVLDNTAANNNARLNVATTLNGGTLSILGNSAAATTETIG